MQGRKHSEESKEKMSKNHKNIINDEVKRKISETKKSQKLTGKDSASYGLIRSKETKRKISKNRTGKGSTRVRNKETGEIFNSIKEAATSCGLKDGTNISAQIRGKGKTACGYT